MNLLFGWMHVNITQEAVGVAHPTAHTGTAL